jgi:predicted DNA-binding transcriptional regulator AlpA
MRADELFFERQSAALMDAAPVGCEAIVEGVSHVRRSTDRAPKRLASGNGAGQPLRRYATPSLDDHCRRGAHMQRATVSDVQNATHIPSPNDLLTARDVAHMLGVTTDWVYAQSRRRRIPTITLGRYRRYRRRAILEWLQTIEDADV